MILHDMENIRPTLLTSDIDGWNVNFEKNDVIFDDLK